MTPELQAAIGRAASYLDALDHERATLASVKPFYVDGRIDERRGTDGNTHVLYRGDIRALLAALDPAEQPNDPDAETRRARQHQAAADLQDLTYQLFPDEPYAPRHRPLTDEPCGVIPTPAGLDYLRDRHQQHPKEPAQ